MYTTLEDKLAALSPERRARIDARAAVLIAEEMTLQELRRARKLTQTRLARKLKVGQESISRLEKRTDLHLSTLRHYVEAMGGSLALVARFPDRAPVELAGIAALEDGTGKRMKRKQPPRKAEPAAKKAASEAGPDIVSFGAIKR